MAPILCHLKLLLEVRKYPQYSRKTLLMSEYSCLYNLWGSREWNSISYSYNWYIQDKKLPAIATIQKKEDGLGNLCCSAPILSCCPGREKLDIGILRTVLTTKVAMRKLHMYSLLICRKVKNSKNIFVFFLSKYFMNTFN